MTIALSSLEGTPIITITATDGDEPNTQNTEIMFTLVDTSLPFTLNETSGQLSSGLGLEGREYAVEVIAADNGMVPGPLSTTGTVTVQVAPANSYDPMFPDNLTFVIEENSSPMGALYEFTVTDGDDGMEGMVQIVLVPSEYSSDFTIQSVNGTLGRIFYSGPGFDREMISNFTLTVQATDQGIPAFRRTSVATVGVTIGDVNDNPPMFVGAPYAVSVSENTAEDTSIAKAMTTDADIGPITYTLLEYGGTEFRIDENTGDILVNGSLSLSMSSRMQHFYRIDINASDGVFTVSTYINITVTEVNDNAPMFSEFSPPLMQAGISLSEDTVVGAVILNISVTDLDTGLSGNGVLSIQQDGNTFRSGSYESNVFYLSLNEELDFEVSDMATKHI